MAVTAPEEIPEKPKMGLLSESQNWKNAPLSVTAKETLLHLVSLTRDSESLPVVNTSYRSVVTCRYSENWLIVLTDKLEISTGLSYCKEHARATGHGYAGQRITSFFPNDGAGSVVRSAVGDFAISRQEQYVFVSVVVDRQRYGRRFRLAVSP